MKSREDMSNSRSRSKKRKSKRRQSKFASLMIVATVITVCILVAVLASDLHRKSRDLAQTETMLEQRIEQATATHESLVAQEQYMKTNQYIEDMAKETSRILFGKIRKAFAFINSMHHNHMGSM